MLIKMGSLPPGFRQLWSNQRLLNVVEQFIGPNIAGMLASKHLVSGLQTFQYRSGIMSSLTMSSCPDSIFQEELNGALFSLHPNMYIGTKSNLFTKTLCYSLACVHHMYTSHV